MTKFLLILFLLSCMEASKTFIPSFCSLRQTLGGRTFGRWIKSNLLARCHAIRFFGFLNGNPLSPSFVIPT